MCLESGSNPYQLVVEGSLSVEKLQHFPPEVEEGLSLIFGLPAISLSLKKLWTGATYGYFDGVFCLCYYSVACPRRYRDGLPRPLQTR